MPEHIKKVVEKRVAALEKRAKPAHRSKRNTTHKVVSAVLTDGTLVETLYRPREEKTLLCVSKDGAWRYEKEVWRGHVQLVPYSPHNNLLKHEAVHHSVTT